MKNVQEIVQAYEKLDVTLSLGSNGGLFIEMSNKDLTPAQYRELREYKVAILDFLTNKKPKNLIQENQGYGFFDELGYISEQYDHLSNRYITNELTANNEPIEPMQSFDEPIDDDLPPLLYNEMNRRAQTEILEIVESLKQSAKTGVEIWQHTGLSILSYKRTLFYEFGMTFDDESKKYSIVT